MAAGGGLFAGGGGLFAGGPFATGLIAGGPFASGLNAATRPTAGVPNYLGSVVMCLTRHYVMTDCKWSHSLGRRFPAELPSGLRHLGARNTLDSGHGL